MSDHFNKVCQYGKSHGTCRCPSRDKKRIEVPCDRPLQHRPKIEYVIDTSLKEQDEKFSIFDELESASEEHRLLTAPPLRARLLEAVQNSLEGILAQPKILDVADAVEQAVKDWLQTETDKLR